MPTKEQPPSEELPATFDPYAYSGLSAPDLPIISRAVATPEPFVQDLRAAGDGSLSVIPRMDNWSDLLSWANITINRSHGWDAAPSGALVWRVVGFYIRSGVAAFIPKFKLENGNPADGIAVVHSWPGAPDLPPGSATPDYTGGKGVAGFTNANGDTGFGFSGGMVYTGSQPFQGPGIIWPLCPQHLPEPKFADAVFGLGWWGVGDHTCPNPIWQLVRKSSVTPPPVPGASFSLAIFKDGIDQGVRLAMVNQSTGVGWELVLLDAAGNEIGANRFV